MKEKWYQKNWFIIVSLIFFFPVGLTLMWVFKKWNLMARIIVSVIVIVLCIISMSMPQNDNSSNTVGFEKNNNIESMKHNDSNSKKHVKKQNTKTSEDKLKESIEQEMTMGKIEVLGFYEGNANILISSSSTLSDKLTKKEINHIIADTLVGLKKSKVKINSANIGVKIDGNRAASSSWNERAINDSESNRYSIYKNPLPYAEEFSTKFK